MTDDKNTEVIVWKKTRQRRQKVQGGAWKVAYADLVTAMMALFIVLWVLNQDRAVIHAVTKYFKNPSGTSVIGEDTSESPSAPKKDGDAIDLKELHTRELQRIGEGLLKALSQSEEFGPLMNQIKIEIVEEGLRIEIVESADDVFFEVGTAKLKQSTDRLLADIGNRLSKSPYKVVIEGHTDSRPYPESATGYSNFELSADRANSARRALIAGGLQDEKIDEIRGHANRKLRDKSDPFGFVNRRISIIVEHPK